MSTIFIVSRFLHILAGFIALFVAPGAMVTQKGSLWHRRWGKIYFWSMAVVAITALIMATYTINLFLFLVAIFSFYLSFSGYRVLYFKRPHKGDKPLLWDWLVVGATLLASIGLLLYGLSGLLNGESFGTVAVVFGFFGSAVAINDLRRFMNPPSDKPAWWYTHMSNMLAAYIATVSAFSAVNFYFLPPVLRWTWPSIVGTIGITIWTSYYKRFFARKTARSTARVSKQYTLER